MEERDFDFGVDLSSLDRMAGMFGEDKLNPEQFDEPQEEPEVPEEDINKHIEQTSDEDPNEGNLEGQTTQENEGQEPSAQDTDDTSSLLTPYAKMLVAEGILPELDLEKFDGTAESLLNAQTQRLQNEIYAGIEDYKNGLDPRVKWLQNNMEMGIPLEDLLKIDRAKTQYNDMSEESLIDNEDLQKSITREYYKRSTKFSDSKIDKEIERLSQLGELEDESKGALTELKTLIAQQETQIQQEAQAEEEAYRQQQLEIIQNFQNTLRDTREIIPGVPVNNAVKDKVYKNITTVVDVNEYGQPLNNIAKARESDPIGFEIKLAYLFEITNGFTKWDVLSSTGKKSAIKDFEEATKKLNMEQQVPRRQSPISAAETNSYLDAMRRVNL